MSSSERQISNLIALYAERIDAGDNAGVADLLAHAGVGRAGDTALVTGRDRILALYQGSGAHRLYPDGTPRTKHVTTNLILEIDEDAGTAWARSGWTVLQATDGLALQPILAGRYHDRFERHDGRWRFAERRYLIDLMGDTSHHLNVTT